MPENDIPSELEPEDDAILNEALQRLRCIIHYFLSAMDESSDSQMKLKADIFRIVTGEGNPPPMIVLAKLHGTTKQNISLQCNHLLAQFNLSKSKFMRTNKFPRKSKQKINQSNDGVMNKSLRKGPPTPPVRNLFDPPRHAGCVQQPHGAKNLGKPSKIPAINESRPGTRRNSATKWWLS